MAGRAPRDSTLLSREPRIAIGTAAGESTTLLSGVVGLARWRHGSVVIGDGGNNRILFFDSLGTFSRVVGRTGSGPAEFRLLYWLGKCGDNRIAAYDLPRQAVVSLDEGGQLGQPIQVPASAEFGRIVRCGSSGDLIVLANRLQTADVPGRTAAQPVALVLVRAAGQVDTLDAGHLQEYYEGRRVPAFIEVPLGRSTFASAGANLIFVADSHEGRVAAFDTLGHRVSKFELKLDRRPVSFEQWHRAVKERLDAHPYARTRAFIDTTLQEIEPRSLTPRIAEIQADVRDQLWIKTFDNFGSAVAVWVVVNREGQPRRAVALPSAFRPFEIGADYLLGVSRDADGVEQVVIYGFPPGR